MKAIKARLSKFSTVDEFIEGWGSYYFSGGLLLPTRNTEPAGTSVSLHIQISTGESVLRGEGTVEEVRTNSSGKPVGMVIRFTKLDASSKDLVRQILDHKKKARTSETEEVIDAGMSGLTDQATGENLAASEIGAIADELEQTFDSIFSGSFLSVDSASQSGFGDEPAAEAEAKVESEEEAASDATADEPAPEVTSPNDEPTVELGDDALDAAAAADAAARTAEEGEEPPNEFEVSGVMDDSADIETAGEPEADDEADAPVEASADEDQAEQPPAEAAPSEAPAAAPEPRLPQGPPQELQPENRVSSFIEEVTGTSAEPEGVVLTHDDVSDGPKVTSLADAAAKAKAAAEEGEAAFDDMLANASMSLPTAGSTPELQLPVRARPKGIFERFFAWLKGLFS